jgi:meso-butanediol dehydrogenase/(S,S)-butanediol dehydrogenase/diacetyl reductase
MNRFIDRTALVVGGANGIGAGIVRRLHAEGATVVVADIDEVSGAALTADLGDRARFIACDVRDEARMESAVESAATAGLDVAIHSAYQNTKVGIEDLSRDDWDEITNTLLRSAFVMTQAAIPHLEQAPDGNIVHISSVAARGGSTRGAAYGASKAGLLSLMRYTAAEFGSRGIRCNAVLPGLIVVDRNRDLWSGERLEQAEARIPLGRAGTPEDVAAAVAFLASTEASAITGTTLTVDGGASSGG